MIRPHTAMILAAGLGTRMRPLTNDRPKPLLRVASHTLLDHAIDRAVEGGARRVVINIHYLGDMIRTHLADRRDVEVLISDECDALLDTGGGLAMAAPLLGPDPVYVLSSDSIWTGPPPLAALAEAWNAAEMDALMLMAPVERALAYARAGDYRLQGPGPVYAPRRRGTEPKAPFVFTSAQILNPATFAHRAPEPFSQREIWDALESAGRLKAVIHAGGWVDVGSPAGLEAATAAVEAETREGRA